MKLSLLLTALYLLACLIHEAGHAATAQAFGLPWRVGIGWLGPYVRITGRYRWHENAAVALGGPMANLLSACVLWLAMGMPATGLLVGLVGAVNLLPVPKSDMWNLLQALRLRKETAC